MNAVTPLAVTNFKGGWNSLWSAITAGFPGLTNLLTLVGVILIVCAVAKWAWERRRGGNMAQGSQGVWGALIIGSLCVAPALLFPLVLGILDWVVNIAYNLVNKGIGA